MRCLFEYCGGIVVPSGCVGVPVYSAPVIGIPAPHEEPKKEEPKKEEPKKLGGLPTQAKFVVLLPVDAKLMIDSVVTSSTAAFHRTTAVGVPVRPATPAAITAP